MCGWVKLPRDLLESELWREVVPFRLFTLLLIQVMREDGRMVNGMQLKRGQYIRAYSKLAEDLSYREGRGEKQYSKSTIKRAADKLVKKGLIATEETTFGTLFTLLKYDEIQNGGSIDFFCPPDRGTVPERKENEPSTKPEQNQEKENEEKVKKDNGPVPATGKQASQKTDERINAISQRFIELRKRGNVLSSKDINAAEEIAGLDVPLAQLLVWMDEIQRVHAKGSSHETINSLVYYEKAILTKLKKSGKKKRNGDEPLLDRMPRLKVFKDSNGSVEDRESTRSLSGSIKNRSSLFPI
ncbi:hypothetical protein [Bacillus sp. T33-2]|uniref:hypothetical protein n=1 Tax=Bacillus sp. T33-2 TaxID=2054168 RepID=UPI000C7791A6|nr:hypothetical protein [Bacillus sp. T33-2]PLR92033.1 hypothetical protein CVD19_21025 [Bacillus sp. T33-2]